MHVSVCFISVLKIFSDLWTLDFLAHAHTSKHTPSNKLRLQRVYLVPVDINCKSKDIS